MFVNTKINIKLAIPEVNINSSIPKVNTELTENIKFVNMKYSLALTISIIDIQFSMQKYQFLIINIQTLSMPILSISNC